MKVVGHQNPGVTDNAGFINQTCQSFKKHLFIVAVFVQSPAFDAPGNNVIEDSWKLFQ